MFSLESLLCYNLVVKTGTAAKVELVKRRGKSSREKKSDQEIKSDEEKQSTNAEGEDLEESEDLEASKDSEHLEVNGEKYDYVVLAAEPRGIMAILENSGILSKEEFRIFDEMSSQWSTSYMHTDERLMPKNRRKWGV